MKLIIATARFWLGVWMVFWGLNWFFRFVPQPTGSTSAYLHLALMHSGLFTVAKTLELLLGIALLTNRLVPVMLVAAAPVTFIVAWVHFVIEHPLPQGYFVVLTHIGLLIAYLPYYRTLLSFKATPMTTPSDVRSLFNVRQGAAAAD